MGACEISITKDGWLTRKQVDAVISAKRDEDRYRNGHQDGYSGDWQTVYDISGPFPLLTGSAEANKNALWGPGGKVEQIDKRSGAIYHTKGKRGKHITVIIGVASC